MAGLPDLVWRGSAWAANSHGASDDFARRDVNAAVVVLLDLPVGFALKVLVARKSIRLPVVVLTNSPCPEYWDDLWDLNPAALLVGIRFDHVRFDTTLRLIQGDHVRQRPRHSQLTPAERRLLSHLAHGWSNEHIARHLRLQDKRVRNMLTRMYSKLKVATRVEAALYY